MNKLFISFFLLIFLFSLGCKSDLGVTKCSSEQWLATQIQNPLIDRGMSYRVKNFLTEESFWESYNNDRNNFLKSLNDRFYKTRNQDVLLALIELTYIEAKEREGIEALYYYMSCAAYSSAYFQNEKLKPAPSPFSPRFIYVCRFYNYSTAEIMTIFQQENFNLERMHDFPIIQGKFIFEDIKSDLPYPISKYKKFLICSNYIPYGFLTSSRTFGLGVPLIAITNPDVKLDEFKKIDDRLFGIYKAPAPATLFLRISYTKGNIFKARMEFYNPYNDTEVKIGNKTAPLEVDITTPLAYMLQDGPTYSGFSALANPDYMYIPEGLYLFSSYDPHKIPLIIVHGLMAQPRTWVQMINTLLNEKAIRENYQLWFFAYPTGYPVLMSAAKLRQTLLDARNVLDPKHINKTFDNSVIIGHSMGGLLTRTMVQNSGHNLEKMLFNKPIEKLDVSPETKKIFIDSLIFKPVPYLKRAIFMATPHRGSELTHSSFIKPFLNLISLPIKVVKHLKELGAKVKFKTDILKSLGKDDLAEIRGVDGLDPKNKIMRYLVNVPISVPYHSIIGNNQQADLIGGTDGVVTYRSAHLDGAESEKVILSGHNVQKTPVGIKEVRRILLLHLKECKKIK
jgi:pimeloyl-ACP methyl ester carboxylesterase